jgi:hypothetical protein
MTDDRTGQGAATPWHFWVVGVVAILWNGFGTSLWGGTSFMAETFLADMPADHRAYVVGLPAWATVTWGLGVLGGLFGSILLLLRNRLAVTMFALSLLGAAVNQMIYVTNPPPTGFLNMPLTLFIIGFAFFLFLYANAMKRRGVI